MASIVEVHSIIIIWFWFGGISWYEKARVFRYERDSLTFYDGSCWKQGTTRERRISSLDVVFGKSLPLVGVAAYKLRRHAVLDDV